MPHPLKIIVIISCVILTILCSMNSNFIIAFFGIFFMMFVFKKENLNYYLLIVVCFGVAINTILAYRINIGVPINILDVLILVLVAELVLNFRKRKDESLQEIEYKDKYQFLMILFILLSIFALFRGIISKYATYNLLKDFRVFIYFVIVYYYSKVYIKSFYDLKKILNSFLISGLVVAFQQIYTFVSKGQTSNFNTADVRDVSVPAGTAILSLLLLIVYFREKPFFKNNKLIYYSLNVLFIIAIILSLTRSIWISAILTSIIYIFISQKRNLKMKRVLIGVSTGVLALIFIYGWSNQLSQIKIFDLVTSRISSAANVFSNKNDTVALRMDVVNYAIDKIEFKGFIFGEGFGSSMMLPPSLSKTKELEITGLENSFVHYCWKLSVLGGITVFLLFILKMLNIYSVFKKIKDHKYSNVIAVFFAYALVTFAIGIFSQAINIAYLMPGWGLFLGINYERIFSQSTD